MFDYRPIFHMSKEKIATLYDPHSEQTDALDHVWLQARSYHFIDAVMGTNLLRFMAAEECTEEQNGDLEEVEAQWDALSFSRRQELASFDSMVTNGLEGTEWLYADSSDHFPASWNPNDCIYSFGLSFKKKGYALGFPVPLEDPYILDRSVDNKGNFLGRIIVYEELN